jgi:hypothetical protein
MMGHPNGARVAVLGASLTVIGCLSSLAAIPRGWFLAGSKPAEYEVTLDHEAEYSHYASVLLRAKQPKVDGFGTLMQQFRADDYRGKRVRLTGSLRAEGVQGWAGLWMRVNVGKLVVAFDNMQGRAVRGTLGWQDYDVVLEIPLEATHISFGVLLYGSGSVWLSHPRFETVPSYVPITGRSMKPTEMEQGDKAIFLRGPVNLDFEN